MGKKSTKSGVIGVRFDTVKLDLLKEREKIETHQQAVNFLLEKYYWENVGRPVPVITPLPEIKPPPSRASEKAEKKIDDLLDKSEEITVAEVEQSLKKSTNEAIQKKIKEIEAEKLPADRNTPIGKKSWAFDQKKKIDELKSRLYDV